MKKMISFYICQNASHQTPTLSGGFSMYEPASQHILEVASAQ